MLRKIAVAGALALGLAALALPTTAQDGTAEPKKALGECHVAKSGGGTAVLPLGDEKKMAELQGLDGGDHPKLELVSPAEDQLFDEKAETLEVKYKLDGYTVGKGDAGEQHVHVVLDDQDYKADYTKDGSIKLTAKDGLTPGTHVLTVFPARAFHLSLKSPGAVSQVRFHWHKKGGEVPAKDAPQAIYSRPKGEYKGDEAKRIMCDFYLLNVAAEDLAAGKAKVVVTVDGPSGKATSAWTRWAPFILLEDPKPGDYHVTLELQDTDGKALGGAWNKHSHKIKVSEK